MKQPIWKIVKSYFADVHIESTSSDVNEELDLYLVRGRYQLCVKNAIYSFGDKYDNYYDAFNYIGTDRIEGKEVLILGFGLGSIPYMLELKGVSARYTAVEYDERVLYLYDKYVDDTIHSPIEFYVIDAYMFMAMNERKFDVIAMDVFVEDCIPEKFLGKEFMHMLKNSLNEDGILIWNHLYHNDDDIKRTDDFFKNSFIEIFPEGDTIRTRGNKMMLNQKIVPSSQK